MKVSFSYHLVFQDSRVSSHLVLYNIAHNIEIKRMETVARVRLVGLRRKLSGKITDKRVVQTRIFKYHAIVVKTEGGSR